MPEHQMPPLDTIMATFADFFRSSPVAMKVLDPQNHILYANYAFENLVGFDEEELRTIQERDIIHTADLYRFRKRFREVVDGESEYSELEARHRHADGHWVPTSLTHMRLPPSGWPAQWILEIVADLTRREEIKQQVTQLQSKQLLGQMARGIAHDFNNLVGAVSLSLEVIAEQAGNDEELQHSIAKTNEMLGKMQALTAKLTRFGNDQPDESARVDLNKAVRTMRDYFEYVCPSSVSVELQLDAEVPVLQAAPMQLEQILLNLVINARDAIVEKGAPGTVRIVSSLEQVDANGEIDLEIPPGRYATLSVHDDGVGMDLKAREQMFEPFFSTKGTAGTGIGLATVYAIVQQGRGYIDVNSTPAEGTSVRVFLPAAPTGES